MSSALPWILVLAAAAALAGFVWRLRALDAAAREAAPTARRAAERADAARRTLRTLASESLLPEPSAPLMSAAEPSALALPVWESMPPAVSADAIPERRTDPRRRTPLPRPARVAAPDFLPPARP